MQTKGYDPVFGARPVKRAVQRELETGLAKALLRGEFGEEDTGVLSNPSLRPQSAVPCSAAAAHWLLAGAGLQHLLVLCLECESNLPHGCGHVPSWTCRSVSHRPLEPLQTPVYIEYWDVRPLACDGPVCSIGVTECPKESTRSDVHSCAYAVIVEAPGGAAADHLEFKAKERRPGNGYKEPALPIEVLV